MNKKSKSGFLMVELLVAIAIIGLVFGSFLQLQAVLSSSKRANVKRIRATYLAIEAIEAVHRVRGKDGWSGTIPAIQGYVTGGVTLYWPDKTTGDWQITACTTPLTCPSIDGYKQEIRFDKVNQDSGGNIVASGGTADDMRRKVTATVKWDGGEYALDTYLTNWSTWGQ